MPPHRLVGARSSAPQCSDGATKESCYVAPSGISTDAGVLTRTLTLRFRLAKPPKTHGLCCGGNARGGLVSVLDHCRMPRSLAHAAAGIGSARAVRPRSRVTGHPHLPSRPFTWTPYTCMVYLPYICKADGGLADPLGELKLGDDTDVPFSIGCGGVVLEGLRGWL